jgi:hypothetical protein
VITPRRAGDAIAAAAGDIARLWRSANGGVRPARIDALAEPFVQALGEALARGDGPGAAWAQAAGTARLDDRDVERSLEEIDAEWVALGTVLAATADALGADSATRAFLAEAIEKARAGSRTLGTNGAPARIVVLWNRRRS